MAKAFSKNTKLQVIKCSLRVTITCSGFPLETSSEYSQLVPRGKPPKGFLVSEGSYNVSMFLLSQVIDLNDNTITEDGSTAMAEVLPNIQELRVINFGDCLLRSGGAKAIAEALKDTHKLLEVCDCSFEVIEGEGGVIILHGKP